MGQVAMILPCEKESGAEVGVLRQSIGWGVNSFNHARERERENFFSEFDTYSLWARVGGVVTGSSEAYIKHQYHLASLSTDQESHCTNPLCSALFPFSFYRRYPHKG